MWDGRPRPSDCRKPLWKLAKLQRMTGGESQATALQRLKGESFQALQISYDFCDIRLGIFLREGWHVSFNSTLDHQCHMRSTDRYFLQTWSILASLGDNRGGRGWLLCLFEPNDLLPIDSTSNKRQGQRQGRGQNRCLGRLDFKRCHHSVTLPR